MNNTFPLPENLPIPEDDGACDHLLGENLPPITLTTTKDELVNLSLLSGWTVVYCYPLSGRPGFELPEDWDQIPGARGCTPQSCAFRDAYSDLDALGVRLFGLSSQTSEYQKELVARLHLPFPLLSDYNLEFASALRLPTFKPSDQILIKRLTLIISDSQIKKVFYPVFPPNKNATDVLAWLEKAV